MMNGTETIAFSAALVMGVASSAHCFGMCGGLAGAFGMRYRDAGSTLQVIRPALLQQTARISGYAILGAICGAAGHALDAMFDLAKLGQYARVLSGVLLLLMAARLLLRWNAFAPLERAGMRVWKHIQPLTRRLPDSVAIQTVAFGLMWGLLPCGMVYSMLAFAALSGSAFNGAALMIAFGIGTMPAMIGSIVAAAKAARSIRSPWMQRASGALLVGFGLWLIVAPLVVHQHTSHVH